MPPSGLSERDIETVRRCLLAAADGPFFEEWEFQTLFGCKRSEVRMVALAWPTVDHMPIADLAINNTLINLRDYPHGLEKELLALTGMTGEDLEMVHSRWSNGNSGGMR